MQAGIGRRGVLGGLLLAGCAGVTVTPEVDAAVEQELRRRPELYTNGEARAWTVRRDGRERGLLWGTVHVPYGDVTVLPRPIRARFTDSASLTIETVPAPAMIAALQREQRAALTRADPAAVAALGADTRAALRTAGVRAEDETKASLLGLAYLVALRAPRAPASALPSMGIVDFNLMGFARSARIPVRGLEVLHASPVPTTQEPNGAAAADALRLTLRRIDAAPAFRETILGYYGRGEVARVMAANVAWRAGPADLAHADAASAAMLGARNRAWMEPLERTLSEPGTHFVAFGCGHLPGVDGVVALLRARGWDVAACVGDRCA